MTIIGTGHLTRGGADVPTVVLTQEPFAPSIVPYTATSATSHTTLAAFGFYTFEIQRYMAFQKGARVRAISNPTSSWIEGIVVSYEGTTLIMKPDRAHIPGAGPYADWTITIAGEVILDNQVICSGEIIDATLVESNYLGAATFSLKTLLGGTEPSPANPIIFQAPSGATRVIREPLSLTIPYLATLGVPTATPFRLWFILVDDVGYDAHLAVIQTRNPSNNSIAGFQGRTQVVTQTPPANLSGVFYSDKAMTDQSYIVLGFMEYDSGLPTAGIWNVSPSRFVFYATGNPLPGDVIGMQGYRHVARNGTLLLIPIDNSVPQQSLDGYPFMGITVTPTDRMSVFVIEAQAILAVDDPPPQIPFVAALFRDDQDNALATTFQWGGRGPVQLQTLTFLGTLNPRLFTTRCGRATATGSQITINGTSGADFFAGTFNSFMRVTERMT